MSSNICMSSIQNKTIARKFVQEIFNNGNVDEAKNLVTPDIIYHGLDEVRGIEGLKKWVLGDRESFPDMQVTIVDDIAEQDKVAMRWKLKGTFEKEFLGIAPTHKELKTHGVEIFHFDNGKIKEAWTIFDTFNEP
jgi:steroid delta-isomerase-like uncharacterized protein